jgi:D-glycero-alpha-D-manno-heptose-7-phosphate kinase
LGYDAKNYLEKSRLDDFGELLNLQWENKRKRVIATEDEFLDEIHYGLLKNGSIGNKIVGSGAGGCFMIYAEDKKKIRKYMKEMQLEEIRFGFDFSGVKQII